MAIKAANRSNVLLTLGVLFTLGAATRFVPTNIADAREADSDEKIETVSTQPDADMEAAKATKAALPVDGQICFSEDLSAALAADQLRLETETEALAARELELQALEAELAETRADLIALQASLETR